jgi:hypothetical protein
MSHKIVLVILSLAIVGWAGNASAAPNILSVVETGGDNEATDTIPAKWTGSSFNVSVANEPVPGLAVGSVYNVGFFGPNSPTFVDRNHRFIDAPLGTTLAAGITLPNPVMIPSYLVGGEYIMSGNDNRDNANYLLNVTVAQPSIVFMLIDNRLGAPNSSNEDPPSFSATKMQWIVDEAWEPIITGNNHLASLAQPDEVGIDEGADGTLNQWYGVYAKQFPAGTFTLRQADNAGQNMYGAVVIPAPVVPEPSTFVLAAVGLSALLLQRRLRRRFARG